MFDFRHHVAERRTTKIPYPQPIFPTQSITSPHFHFALTPAAVISNADSRTLNTERHRPKFMQTYLIGNSPSIGYVPFDYTETYLPYSERASGWVRVQARYPTGASGMIFASSRDIWNVTRTTDFDSEQFINQVLSGRWGPGILVST